MIAEIKYKLLLLAKDDAKLRSELDAWFDFHVKEVGGCYVYGHEFLRRTHARAEHRDFGIRRIFEDLAGTLMKNQKLYRHSFSDDDYLIKDKIQVYVLSKGGL